MRTIPREAKACTGHAATRSMVGITRPCGIPGRVTGQPADAPSMARRLWRGSAALATIQLEGRDRRGPVLSMAY